jgi:hypothetical protein
MNFITEPFLLLHLILFFLLAATGVIITKAGKRTGLHCVCAVHAVSTATA